MNDDAILREIRGSDAERLLLLVAESRQSYAPSEARALFDGDSAAASWADNQLEQLGLVSSERSLANEITATPRGRVIASKIKQSRIGGPERWDRVARAIATSLIETGGWHVEEVDGIPVTENETQLAIQHLKQWRLVNAAPRADGKIYAVLPLDRIHEVPGITGLLRDFYEGVPSYNDHRNTTSIHGSTVGAVQTGGHANVQRDITQHVVGASERAQILALVGAALAEVGDDGPADLRAALDAIKDEASEDEPERESLKGRIVEGVVVAGASAASQTVLQALAQMLGIV